MTDISQVKMDAVISAFRYIPPKDIISIVRQDKEMDMRFRQYVNSGYYLLDTTGGVDEMYLPDIEQALLQFDPKEGYPHVYHLILQLFYHKLLDTLPNKVYHMLKNIYDIRYMFDSDERLDITRNIYSDDDMQDFDYFHCIDDRETNPLLYDHDLIIALNLFDFAAPELWLNEEFKSNALSKYPNLIHYLDPGAEENIHTQSTGDLGSYIFDFAFGGIPGDRMSDIPYIVSYVGRHPASYLDLPVHLQHNKEIIINTVTADEYMMQYVPEEYRKDRDVVLAADGYRLECVPREYKEDRDIILAAVKKNIHALKNAYFESYESDMEIASYVLSQDGRMIEYFSPSNEELFRKMLMIAVRQNGSVLKMTTYINDPVFLCAAMHEYFD